MDAYEALMQELGTLKNTAPAAPMFSMDEQRRRIRENNQQVNLGLVGQLSPDEQAQSVGASVFKNALGNRAEKNTPRGTFDPLSGVTAEDPEYVQAQQEARRGKVLDAALRVEEKRRADQMRADEQRANRESREAQAAEGRALRLTIAGMADQRAAAKDAAKAEGKAAGKTLPGGEVRKLTEAEGLTGTFGDLASGFKPELAGTPGLAPLQNTVGKYFGAGYEAQSNWWQNYNDQKNLVRNKLFGSALTASEKAAFDAANISEGMDAKQIKIRLAQQHRAAVKAYNKLKGNFGRAGYDVSNFEDLLEPAAELPGAAPTTPSAPQPGRRLRFNPATGALE